MAPIGGFIFVGIIGLVLFTTICPSLFALLRVYTTRSATAKSSWQPKLLCGDLLIAALVCATLYAVGRAVFFPYKSPGVLFQEEIEVPIPKSLRVLKQESDEGSTWAHSPSFNQAGGTIPVV